MRVLEAVLGVWAPLLKSDPYRTEDFNNLLWVCGVFLCWILVGLGCLLSVDCCGVRCLEEVVSKGFSASENETKALSSRQRPYELEFAEHFNSESFCLTDPTVPYNTKGSSHTS